MAKLKIIKDKKIITYKGEKIKAKDSQLKVLFIDTNLGLDHAWRFAEDNHIVYLYQAEVSAFPKISDIITGYGFHKNLEIIEDLGKVLNEVDLVVILDNVFPYLTDYLKSRNKLVFAPSNLLVELELNKTYAYYKLKELGIGVPEGEVVRGFNNLIEFIKEKEDNKTKFWIKINKIRGNIETFFVKSHKEVITYLAQAHLGPFIHDLEFLVQYDCEGIEIGCDMIVSSDFLVFPFSFTLEEKGSGNVAKWIFDESQGFVTLFYDKLKSLIQDDNYRCFLCVEGFYDGKDLKVLDITSRFPYPVSSLYPRFIENYCEVIYKVASNERVEAKVDTENVYMFEITGYTIETNMWRPIHINNKKILNVKGEGIGFRRVIKYDDCIWFVPGDAVVFTINTKGKNIEEAYNKAITILDNVHCYSVEYDLGFYYRVKNKIENLNKLGSLFQF